MEMVMHKGAASAAGRWVAACGASGWVAASALRLTARRWWAVARVGGHRAVATVAGGADERVVARVEDHLGQVRTVHHRQARGVPELGLGVRVGVGVRGSGLGLGLWWRTGCGC